MKVGGMGNIRNIRESVRDFKKSGDQLKWTHSNVTFCGYNVVGCWFNYQCILFVIDSIQKRMFQP